MNKRTYVGELEWALQQISDRWCDDNFMEQLSALTRYGLEVAKCRRERWAGGETKT